MHPQSSTEKHLISLKTIFMAAVLTILVIAVVMGVMELSDTLRNVQDTVATAYTPTAK